MKILEAIINYSQGRNQAVIDAISACFQKSHEVLLMDVHQDPDYNRMVVSVIGSPDPLLQAIVESVIVAKRLINVNHHIGEHPFIGATDVIPLVAISDISEQEAIAYSQQLGQLIGNLGIPVFMYEKSYSNRLLASIRKGGLQNLQERMRRGFAPEYGPNLPHPTAGATVVGLRKPLVAYNITLDSDDLPLAKRIARTIRESSGGMPAVSAIGVYCQSRGKVQVSCNLRDVSVTSIDEVFDAVNQLTDLIIDSEIIGCVLASVVTDPKRLKLLRYDEKMIVERQVETLCSRINDYPSW